MGILHAKPFFFGFAYFLLVLIGDIRLLAVNGIADVDFIFENTLNLGDRPCVTLFLGSICVDIGERSVSRVVEPAGRGNLLVNQNTRNFGSTCSAIGKIKDLFNDPTGFLIDLDQIFDFTMLLVTKRRICTDMLSCGKLGVKRGFDFTAGILGKPFIEQVLERYEIGKPFLVSSFSDTAIYRTCFSGNSYSR